MCKQANTPDLTPDLPPYNSALMNSDFTAALGIVVAAFVDLGFGESAAQHAERAANDNTNIASLAIDCLASAKHLKRLKGIFMIVKSPDTLPKKKCVIYARVSSTKQTSDEAGLSSQERSCREYAARRGLEVAEIFTDVISGRFAERPGMNALLAHLRQARAEEYVVVVDDISRFARDVSTHLALREKIVSHGAKIESPNGKFGEDAGGRFVEMIMAALAAHDGQRNAEQAHSRTVARLQSGYWVFHAPLGYRFEKGPRGRKDNST